MKKYFLFLIALMYVVSATAQTENSAFNLTGSGYSTTTATDYQCLGINPANLGWTWNNRSINLGLLESGFSVYAEPLSRNQVKDLFNNKIELSLAEKQEAAQQFVNKRITSNIAVTWLGISYQDDKIGGFAFAIRERFSWNSVLNGYGAQFLFLGFHDPYFDSLSVQPGGDTIGYSTTPRQVSDLYAGTTQNFLWTREYNLGYGRIIMDKEHVKWYGGIDVKYMTVFAGTQYFDVDENGVVGFSSLAPYFNVNYDEPTPSQLTGDGLKKVGWGWGLGIGTTILLYDKVKIGLALNDIGQIKFNGNVYQGRNTEVWKNETHGIDNYNIFQEGQLVTADSPPGDSSLWYGLKEKSYNTPMNFRGGVSYRIIDKVEIGTDILIPVTQNVPGSYEKMVFGVGGRYNPAKWVELSVGLVSGGKFGTNVPLGVTFFPLSSGTVWQVGLATRDVVTLFNSKTPTVSVAMGFLRFSFGTKRTPVAKTPDTSTSSVYRPF